MERFNFIKWKASRPNKILGILDCIVCWCLLIALLSFQTYFGSKWKEDFRRIKIVSISDDKDLNVRSVFDQKGVTSVREIITQNGQPFGLSLEDTLVNRWTEVHIPNNLWQIPIDREYDYKIALKKYSNELLWYCFDLSYL